MTVTELAGYAAGMPREQYLTARLCWCLDKSVVTELRRILAQRSATPLAKLGENLGAACTSCGQQVQGIDYRRQLAGLAVAEMLRPESFGGVEDRAAWMRVARRTWYRTHAEPYAVVLGCLIVGGEVRSRRYWRRSVQCIVRATHNGRMPLLREQQARTPEKNMTSPGGGHAHSFRCLVKKTPVWAARL